MALIDARTTRKTLGISEMTLWRLTRNPGAGFPQPIKIGRKRYWDSSEVQAYVQDRRVEAQRDALQRLKDMAAHLEAGGKDQSGATVRACQAAIEKLEAEIGQIPVADTAVA